MRNYQQSLFAKIGAQRWINYRLERLAFYDPNPSELRPLHVLVIERPSPALVW
jgi:hypothetical protein